MTMSQAYYKMVFDEHGVTDEAMEHCKFCALLIVKLRVDELIEKEIISPPKVTIYYHRPKIEWDKGRFEWFNHLEIATL